LDVPRTLQELLDAHELRLSLLVRAGSKAYGIDVEGSDDDFVGVFVAPTRRFVSIGGLDRDTYEGRKPDFTVHEIGKFCRLALKGNPAILEALWNPDVVAQDRWGEALLQRRALCLHHGSLDVYVKYAESQLKKMVKGRALKARGGSYNGKYGAHLVRLLHSGIHLARTREVTVRLPADLADELLKIRSGALSMGHVLDLARPLLAELKELANRNTLAASPDRTAFDELVVAARLSRIEP
jgi:hypothetical protein